MPHLLPLPLAFSPASDRATVPAAPRPPWAPLLTPHQRRLPAAACRSRRMCTRLESCVSVLCCVWWGAGAAISGGRHTMRFAKRACLPLCVPFACLPMGVHLCQLTCLESGQQTECQPHPAVAPSHCCICSVGDVLLPGSLRRPDGWADLCGRHRWVRRRPAGSQAAVQGDFRTKCSRLRGRET
jgi:hypothetical protein